MKRVVMLFVVLSLCLYLMPSVYAVADNDNLAELFSILKANGFSDVAAAAIVGNVSGESGGNPASVEGGKYGVGIGVFQLGNNTNRQGLEDYCAGVEHDAHQKVTLTPPVSPKSYTVCNRVSCQVEYALKDMASTFSWKKWSSNYNAQVQSLSVLSQGVSSGSIPASISVVNSWSGFKEQSDLKTAVIQFMCDYETPGSTSCFWVGVGSYNDSEDIQRTFVDSVELRYAEAKAVYDKYAGSVWVPVEESVVEEQVEVDIEDTVGAEEVLDVDEVIESEEVLVEQPVALAVPEDIAVQVLSTELVSCEVEPSYEVDYVLCAIVLPQAVFLLLMLVVSVFLTFSRVRIRRHPKRLQVRPISAVKAELVFEIMCGLALMLNFL